MAGGHDGACGSASLIRASGTTEVLKGKGSVYAGAGDVIRIETPGGGGWGPESDT
ncbi:MAG: hydantoinase B/oxoprolinase family protein [Terracidiphilus sp.]